MKHILLLVCLNIWYIHMFAQNDNKVKPLESTLNSSKRSLSKDVNSSMPVFLLRLVRNDSVFVFKGDTLLIRRSIKAPAHKLEEQLPMENALTDGGIRLDSSKIDDKKPEKSRQSKLLQ